MNRPRAFNTARLALWSRRTGAAVVLAAFLLGWGLDAADGWLGWVTAGLGEWQLFPAVIRASGGVAFSVAILAGLVLLTILAGRVFCAMLCPLGILQDVLIRCVAFWRRHQRPRRGLHVSPPRAWLRYGLLAAFLLSAAVGPLWVAGWLDPFSIFGRLANGLFWPALLACRNTLAMFLMSVGYFNLSPAALPTVVWPLTFFAAAFFVLLVLLAWRGTRGWCNAFCPVGTLLGLLSRYSIWKLSISESACTGCGRCARVCKADCIDRAGHHIDFERCVWCLKCLVACDDGAIAFRTGQPSAMEHVPANSKPGRRAFLASLGMLGLGAARVERSAPRDLQLPGPATSAIPPPFGPFGSEDWRDPVRQSSLNSIAANRQPVMPPGARERSLFHNACTACHRCVSVCPTRVIRPDTGRYGWSGFWQPHLDFQRSFCNRDCRACGDVCPTGALQPLSAADKPAIQMGVALILEHRCIPFKDGKDCGACSEHCPTKAVDLVRYPGSIHYRPVVNPDLCTGCGACEYACPPKPKAIVVLGHRRHQTALRLKIGPPQMDSEPEEFPF